MMQVYIIKVEYEITRLVTIDKQEWIKQLNEIAKPDGELHPGDWSEVWQANKKLYDVYRLSDIR